MVGETLGSYKILDKLGEGGMGVVYLAEHALIGRKAAIKLLRPECSSNAEIVNRFFNEARSTALIKHSGLVDIFDFGYHTDGSAFIVMEFLEGTSLASRLEQEGRLPPDVLVAVARQLAAAVHAAHEKGIVHRDLKPDNVFLVADDVSGGMRVKVLDFGIAKLAGENSHGLVKTRTGSMMGTPLYMSPEQCRGAGAVDRRADIYALGCILYEMSTGRPPFLGEGPGDVIVGHLTAAPEPPSKYEPGIKPELETLILACLAKKPDDRPATMAAVAAELDRVAGRRQPSGGIPRPAARIAIGTDVGAGGLDQTVAPDVAGTSRPLSAAAARTSGFGATAHATPSPGPGPSARGTGTGVAGAAALGTGPDLAEPTAPAAATAAATVPPASAMRSTSTTFGGAAAEVVPVPTSSKRWLVPAAAAVLVAAVAAAYFLFLRPKTVETRATTPRASASATPAPTPTQLAAPAPSPSASPAAPTLPSRVHLKVDSTPPGADVFRLSDGVLLGTTPHVEEMPRGNGKAVFLLKLAGHQDARVALSIAEDAEFVQAMTPINTKSSGRKHTDRKSRKPPGGQVEVKDGTFDPFK